MAAPAPSDKVKDKEYINWLKVTLALYYMKSGLHTFIQGEFDCLHQSLIHKIYGGKTVPLPPCTTCHNSHVKRNKFSGLWAFQKQCKSFCDVWLYELLKLHSNPKSEKIYWANSDVPAWPFKPWECAKVFMPRGQLPSNTGPVECDAQALLTLLASCTHFHPKLSTQGLGLTHTVSTVRNKVMHDSEMKLSDADRMSFIQQIIQLLEDPVTLKSSEDCKAAVSNIHKIDNDSVDICFNLDLEMTAVRAAVDDFRRELGMQEKRNVDSVDFQKEEYMRLKKQLTERFEYVEKELELHQERFGTVEEKVKLQGERLGAVEDTVELCRERLDAIEETVELHGERLDAVEENTGLHAVRIGAVEKDVANLQGEIIQMIREKSSCMKETYAKLRPESDGLRQLKNQTEDKLDTAKRLGFIPTKQMEEARKLLQDKRSIVIQGNPGEGKTTTALHLIDDTWCIDKRVLVNCPRDWKTIDTDWVDIVILDDIFVHFDLDPSYLQEWLVYLPTIQEHVDAGKLQVIITTRLDILAKAYTNLGSINLFCNEFSLTMSSDKLQESEKIQILNRELHRHKRHMQDDKKKKMH